MSRRENRHHPRFLPGVFGDLHERSELEEKLEPGVEVEGEFTVEPFGVVVEAAFGGEEAGGHVEVVYLLPPIMTSHRNVLSTGTQASNGVKGRAHLANPKFLPQPLARHHNITQLARIALQEIILRGSVLGQAGYDLFRCVFVPAYENYVGVVTRISSKRFGSTLLEAHYIRSPEDFL